MSTVPARQLCPTTTAGPAGRARRFRAPLAGAAIAVLALLAHSPSIPGEFLWDDGYWIWDNPVLAAGQAPWGYWWTTRTPDYLPVTSSFLYLQRQVWGERPEHDPRLPYPALPYRAANVALHALAAVLVWRVLAVLGLPGAWLAAALFAVHPVTVASAGWVAETKNTLSLVFYALALLAYLRFDATGRGRLYLAAMAAFALALLTKTSTVVLPGVLAVLLWWRRRPWTPRALAALAGLVLLALTAGAVTLWFQGHYAIRDIDVGGPHGPWQRLLTAAKAAWFYAFTAAAPVRLNMIYPKWDPAALDWTALAVPALLAWAVLLAGLRGRAWVRWATAATACFLLSLGPVLGLVDMSFMQFSYVSDHLAYLALPVPMAAAAALAGRLWRRGGPWRPGVAAAAVAVLALLTATTALRARTFAERRLLWTDTLRRNPAAQVAHSLLGKEMVDDGQNEQALAHLRLALELRPADQLAQACLARACGDLGRHQTLRGEHAQAAEYYVEALRHRPDNPENRGLLGLSLLHLDRPDEALAHLGQAALARPDWPEVHLWMGQALERLGEPVRAAQEYRRASALQGGSMPATRPAP